MDPTTNQPTPNGQASDPQPKPTNTPQDVWPKPQDPVPDWQQGLGTSTVQPPVPGAPQPPQPAAGTPAMQQMPTGVQQIPGAVQTSSSDGEMGAPTLGVPGPKKKPPLLFLIIGLIIVIVLAAGTYFFIHGNKKTANSAAQTSENSVAKSTINLSTLTGATLNTPSDMSAFQANTSTTANQYSFLTKTSTSTNLCQLQLGVYTSAQMPGADLNDIVKQGLTSQTTATVTGPSAGPALVLKDATKSSVMYSIPTLQYELTEGNKHATFVLSIAILKNGNRAFVGRECANANGAIDQSGLSMLENIAAKITVTKS